MKSKHINKCIQCSRTEAKHRYTNKLQDPEWVSKEKIRVRNKYHRKKYKNKPKNQAENRLKHAIKYPYKVLARLAAKSIECPDGFSRHHWNYSQEFWRDVIVLPNDLHHKIHRYMKYDHSTLCFKTLDGVVLSDRSTHERFIDIIRMMPN